MRTTDGTMATSIQEIRSTAAGRGARAALDPSGAGALAGVYRGLFGGLARQQARPRRPMPDETVEITVPRHGILPLSSAA